MHVNGINVFSVERRGISAGEFEPFKVNSLDSSHLQPLDLPQSLDVLLPQPLHLLQVLRVRQ